MSRLDKTLLFGNGINLLTPEGINWNDLLDKIKKENQFENGKLPNTMIYERILLEPTHYSKYIIEAEMQIKEEIAKELDSLTTNNCYNSILDLGLKNYITTNYDYSLNKKSKEKECYIKNNSTEVLYSIRRNTSIIDNKTNNKSFKIWNIHGEISNPASIMLGLDHYCKSIGQIDSYLNGTYKYRHNREDKKTRPIKTKIKENIFDNTSWIDLFFSTDIHIIGLSLQYSEIDLWWILNTRARIQAKIKSYKNKFNKIFYYTPNIEPEKQGLLESFNVNVVINKKYNCLNSNNTDWDNYYKETLEIIKST